MFENHNLNRKNSHHINSEQFAINCSSFKWVNYFSIPTKNCIFQILLNDKTLIVHRFKEKKRISEKKKKEGKRGEKRAALLKNMRATPISLLLKKGVASFARSLGSGTRKSVALVDIA